MWVALVVFVVFVALVVLVVLVVLAGLRGLVYETLADRACLGLSLSLAYIIICVSFSVVGETVVSFELTLLRTYSHLLLGLYLLM